MENFLPQFRLAVDVLQGSQDGHDLITTIQIELNAQDGPAIESLLA
jgi:hypothetical protein